MLHNLRAARDARHMSQSAAAAIIGKGQATYSKIERGEVKLGARDALTLCNAFGLTLAALLESR